MTMNLNVTKNVKTVSSGTNTYFVDRKITVEEDLPTSGLYMAGDIIVNIGSTKEDAPMWICTETGTPGKWTVVGVGERPRIISSSEIVQSETSTVPLASLGCVVGPEEKLMVHYNSTYLLEGEDFIVINGGTAIEKIEGTWNEDNEICLFTFDLFKNIKTTNKGDFEVDTKLARLQNTVSILDDVTEVSIGISTFDKENDILMVFKNSTFLTEYVDYIIDPNGAKIISKRDTWKGKGVEDYTFTFIVIKNIPVFDASSTIVGQNIAQASIGINHFSNEVRKTFTQNSSDVKAMQERIDAQEATIAELQSALEELRSIVNTVQNNLDDDL